MSALKDISTLPPKQAKRGKCKNGLMAFHKRLFELQNVFYADGRYGLLIILQGMDTSGKDGTIRHVMTCMNPMGLRVQSFKKPTEDEQNHDFLWRVYPHIPPKSIIQVFNRSYYEDIIIPVVNQSQPKDLIMHRLNLINEIEQHLVENDIHILKSFLHISHSKQQERIKERLSMLHKRWKYSKDDETAAKKWDAYLRIYDTLIVDCNYVPWHIIPADKRWYRNYSVAKTIIEYLEKLNLKYPNK
ncbi:polyphosphate kinase [Echinicola jeungdonensis]|uniref:PPK2 family polyphosphate kinase n=1 Tax=Echinicola jeungdonensis TaxID=709343 RepID=A0ABV5J6G2_9BACT|nr:PPK2 family polyphosphate kinase [Echinicola jeungdonensis]MDN3670903.1 polyphosphate kinase [Echinicola jeungdonensis]